MKLLNRCVTKTHFLIYRTFINTLELEIASIWQTNVNFSLFRYLQSQLSHIGESRMEKDFKLCENEGLFQEYLEMGKNIDRNNYAIAILKLYRP